MEKLADITRKYADFIIGDGVFQIGNSDKIDFLILGCVHGNEHSGLYVIERILENSELFKGRNIRMIIANLDAIKLNKRFVEIDMNRLLGEGFEENLPNNSEGARLKYLLPFLQNFDLLIDIHNTIRPSNPFIYCENSLNHINLAKKFNIADIISIDISFPKNDKNLFSSFDNYADRIGKLGITIESGAIDNMNWEVVYEGILNISNHSSNFDIKNNYIIYHKIIARDNFNYIDSGVYNLQFYENGSKIASENGVDILVNRDSYVIFPKKEFRSGDICGFLAYKNE